MNSFEDAMDRRDERLQQQDMRIQHMDSVIRNLREELDNIKMVASVSENTKQEAVNELKKRHQNEIESLRAALEESYKNSELELREQFERERTHNYAGTNEVHEVSMEQAQSEADKLKSVVLPLENEIKILKSELTSKSKQFNEATLKLNEHSLNNMDQASETCVNTVECPDFNEETIINESKLQNDENYYLKEQLRKVCKRLKKESCEHAVLKHTWTAANDQFLESHRLLQRDVSLMETVLEDEQKQTVKMLKLREQAKEAQSNLSSVKSPTSSLVLLRQRTEEYKELATKDLKTPDDETESFGSFQDFQAIVEPPSEQGSRKNSSVEEQKSKWNEDDVKSRKELEESIMQVSDESVKQIRDLLSKLENFEWRTTEIKQQQMDATKKNIATLHKLAADRDRVKLELNSVTSDRDRIRSLLERRDKMVTNEAFVMPRTPEMSRVELEHSLSEDLTDCRKQVHSLETRLVQVQKDRDAYKDRHEKEQLSLDAVVNRSKEIIKNLRQDLDKEIKTREHLEKQLSELKNKLHSLQESLETSEQVQHDFVRLSQQLQIQLEQVRLKEEEETKKREELESNNISPSASTENALNSPGSNT